MTAGDWVHATADVKTSAGYRISPRLEALYERVVEYIESLGGPFTQFTNKQIHHALGGHPDAYACALAATTDMHGAGLLRRVSRPRTRPYVYSHAVPMGRAPKPVAS